MVDKLTNITQLVDGDLQWVEKINHNFDEVKTKVGLTFIRRDAVTIPKEGVWTMATEGSKFKDVDNPDNEIEEQCVGKIQARAFIEKVFVPDPATLYVTYTDLLVLPHIVCNNPDNVDMRRTIASCGVELEAHTKLDALKIDPQTQKKYVNLLFSAQDGKPTIDLKFDLVLF